MVNMKPIGCKYKRNRLVSQIFLPFIKFGNGNIARLAGFVKIELFSGIIVKELYK